MLTPERPGPLLLLAPLDQLADPPGALPPAATVTAIPWPDGEDSARLSERVLAELARLGLAPADPVYDEREEQQVAARLEALGYL